MSWRRITEILTVKSQSMKPLQMRNIKDLSLQKNKTRVTKTAITTTLCLHCCHHHSNQVEEPMRIHRSIQLLSYRKLYKSKEENFV